MWKNIAFCLAGLVVGFLVGFVVAIDAGVSLDKERIRSGIMIFGDEPYRVTPMDEPCPESE